MVLQNAGGNDFMIGEYFISLIRYWWLLGDIAVLQSHNKKICSIGPPEIRKIYF